MVVFTCAVVGTRILSCQFSDPLRERAAMPSAGDREFQFRQDTASRLDGHCPNECSNPYYLTLSYALFESL